jgi:hypothetical protein
MVSQSGSQQLKVLEEKEKRDSLTITERVELAKIRGKKQVLAQTIVTLHPVAATPEEVEQLLPKYTIVLAEAVGEFGYFSDSRSIMSWYTFRTIDVLSQAPPQQTFAVRQIPEQLLPLKDDQFLVPTKGGTATIDGVEVIQNDQTIPRFKKSRKYLLLLSLNPSTRIAELPLGPQSILPVNPDNSLDRGANVHLLQQAIMRFHNSSLDQLKRNIHK